MNIFSKISRGTWITVFAVVVLGLVGQLLVTNYSMKQYDTPVPDFSATQKNSKITATSKPISAQAKAEVYSDLVKQYEGYRIQFDALCQAIPNNMTFRNGVKIMLDNRSGDARYISVGGVSHYIDGYGYKIVTISSTNLPKTLFVNCGAAVNVAQILVQQ